MGTIQPLSPLDWLMPRSYIRQLLFFREAPAVLADRLEAGLVGAVAAMPHLAGAVVDHPDPPGSVALLVGGTPDTTALFSRQDLTDTLDYEVLRRAHFPPSALRGSGTRALFDPDVDIATGRGGGGGGGGEGSPPAPPPVFRARLTCVRGGAVLAVAVHHATTDITGLGALLGVWAAHCRGDDGGGGFTPAWCDRAPLCVVAPPPPSTASGNDDGRPPLRSQVPELLFFEDENETVTPDPVPRRFAPAPDTPFATGLFAFAASQLQMLRDGVVRAATAMTVQLPWVSTGDILTAVLYSAVVDALHGDEDENGEDENGEDDEVAEISVPVNLRAQDDVPLPAGYLGAAFGRARVRVPLGALREVARRFADEGGCDEEAEEGGEATSGSKNKQQAAPSALHRALAPVALAVRRAITGARATPIGAALAFLSASDTDVAALRRRPARALSVVSWADEGVSALAWDYAGTRCEAVRVPGQPGRAGRNYVVVLPRRPDGTLEVLVGLERAAMARLAGPRALVARLAAVRWIEDVV